MPMNDSQRTIAIGSIPHPAADTFASLGPEHPMRAGLVLLRVMLSDGVVTKADVESGFLHRGAEKLFEVRDLRQVLMLADRHDWQAAFAGELVVTLAAEQSLGLIPPPRATWLRTLLAEQARVGSHLSYLTWVPHALERSDVSARLRDVREQGRWLMLQCSGNRVHPMLTRLGGVAMDVNGDLVEAFARWADDAARIASLIAPLVDELSLRWPGIAPLDPQVIDQYGLSGPAVRAAGVQRDLRRDDSYLSYAELQWPKRLGGEGTDAAGRFLRWITEIDESARLVRQCVVRLASMAGPVNVPLAKIIKLPEGEQWVRTEAPQGEASVFVVSRGDRTPWRLKLRTPSFSVVAAWSRVLTGVPLEALEMALASLPYTIGDLDK